MVKLVLPDPLFLDGEAVVIDKPAGLPVDRPRAGGPSVESLSDDLRFGFARRPQAAHRLDRDTSGCLLLARNPKALARFGAAFESGEVAKTYLAVVAGVPAAGSGEICEALAKTSSREGGWRMVLDRQGKPAVTRWRRLDVSEDGCTLLLLEPATGRTHQLRVHLADALGLPIVGDPVYGRAAAAPMLLHAWRLKVARGDKPAIAAEAPLPARFAAAGFAEVPPDAG